VGTGMAIDSIVQLYFVTFLLATIISVGLLYYSSKQLKR